MNYRYLKGKIIEKCGSQNKFAECLDISKQALSNKMNSKTSFSQEQIIQSKEILGLNDSELVKCFFNY